MKCEEMRGQAALYLYGELSFQEEEELEAHAESCQNCREALERERAMHRALDAGQTPVGLGALAASRRELSDRVEKMRAEQGFFGRFGMRWKLVSAPWQPVGAVALLLLGYLGARIPSLPFFGAAEAGVAGPMASRVRYVEPEPSGNVRIVVEEAHQRVLTGRPDEERMRRLLMSGARDPADAGLRVVSLDMLKSQTGSAEVREALLHAVRYDPNAGVRLKALEALKTFAEDPAMRRTLTQVLLTDKNPGVRTQVIDLLAMQKNDQMVGLLQELLHQEDNTYVREQCQRVLRGLNASEGTF